MLTDRPAPNNIMPFGSWLPERHRAGYPSEKSNRSRILGPSEMSSAGPSNSGSMAQHDRSNNYSFGASQGHLNVVGQHERNNSATNASPLSQPLQPTPGSDYSSSAGSETPLIPPARELPYTHTRTGSQVRLHQDSGIRLPPPASLVDVPPLYSRE